jgi:hypothetical protein
MIMLSEEIESKKIINLSRSYIYQMNIQRGSFASLLRYVIGVVVCLREIREKQMNKVIDPSHRLVRDGS